eukprot:6491208-Amphidinium_carterae.3
MGQSIPVPVTASHDMHMQAMPHLPVPTAPWTPPNQISSLDMLDVMGMHPYDASVVSGVTSARTAERSRSRTAHGSDASASPEE